MKNLSLLLLTLAALPIEASSNHLNTIGTDTIKSKRLNVLPVPAGPRADSIPAHTGNTNIISKQPSAANPVVTKAAIAPIVIMAPILVDPVIIITKSYDKWNGKIADKRKRRFKDGDIVATLKNHINPVAMKGKVYPLATKIRHTKGLDEEIILKKAFAPVIQSLKDKTDVKAQGLFKDDLTAAETQSGSTHEIYGPIGCPKISILSDLPAVHDQSTRESKLFEAGRLYEIETMLTQLEGFVSLEDAEILAYYRLIDLKAEKKLVISSLTEVNRIENEKKLTHINRAIIGVQTQYETIKVDRERKSNLIAQLRDQAGTQVAGVGLLRWAIGKTDVSHPTLQAIFHNTKTAELVLKKEKTKIFLEFLKLLPTPKHDPKNPIGISTALQDPRSFKFVLVMEGKKAAELATLSQKEDKGFIYQMPKHIKNAPTLVALYTARVSAPENLLHSTNIHTSIPTIEELYAKRKTKTHWSAKGFDDRTLEWEKIVPAPAEASSELGTA